MTTFGDMAFAMGGVPLLPSIPFGRASKAFFCAPGTDSGGSDGNRGTNVKQPLATLSKAQTLATADHNDTVFMIASSNTAANTTDYQSSALAWAKDGVPLIGVNSGNQVGWRRTNPRRPGSHLPNGAVRRCNAQHLPQLHHPLLC